MIIAQRVVCEKVVWMTRIKYIEIMITNEVLKMTFYFYQPNSLLYVK